VHGACVSLGAHASKAAWKCAPPPPSLAGSCIRPHCDSHCDAHTAGWDEILEGGLAEGATVMSWRVSETGRIRSEAALRTSH
jgi:hypothetical protein